MDNLKQLRRDVITDLSRVQAATLQREQTLISAIEQLAHAVERLGGQMKGGLPNDVQAALYSAVGTAHSAASGPRL